MNMSCQSRQQHLHSSINRPRPASAQTRESNVAKGQTHTYTHTHTHCGESMRTLKHQWNFHGFSTVWLRVVKQCFLKHYFFGATGKYGFLRGVHGFVAGFAFFSEKLRRCTKPLGPIGAQALGIGDPPASIEKSDSFIRGELVFPHSKLAKHWPQMYGSKQGQIRVATKVGNQGF